MKTLRRGTPPPRYPWIGVWSCPYCHGIYEVTEEDKDLNPQYHDDQRDGAYIVILCPACEVRRSMHAAGRPKTTLPDGRDLDDFTCPDPVNGGA